MVHLMELFAASSSQALVMDDKNINTWNLGIDLSNRIAEMSELSEFITSARHDLLNLKQNFWVCAFPIPFWFVYWTLDLGRPMRHPRQRRRKYISRKIK